MSKVVLSLAIVSLSLSGDCLGMNVRSPSAGFTCESSIGLANIEVSKCVDIWNGIKCGLGVAKSLVAENSSTLMEAVSRRINTWSISGIAGIVGSAALGAFALWDFCSNSTTFKSTLSSWFLGSSLSGSTFSYGGANYPLDFNYFTM